MIVVIAAAIIGILAVIFLIYFIFLYNPAPNPDAMGEKLPPGGETEAF